MRMILIIFFWCFVNLMQVSSDHEIEEEEDEEMHLTDKPVFIFFFRSRMIYILKYLTFFYT